MNGSALRQNIVSFGNPILINDQNCGQQMNPYLNRQNPQNEYQIEEHLEVIEERVPGCCFISGIWRRDCNIFRVIALICSFFVDFLMLLCLLSTNWLTTNKYRQGLWQYCIEADSPRPLPFGLQDSDGCHWGRDAAYIRLSGFFCVACFVLAFTATILTAFGLSSRDPNRKYTFYRFALYINLAALLAVIVALTLYPAFFYNELHHSDLVPANRPLWYFGWAYGVGWGSAIFLIGAILLLVCDKETEEIYYKERTILHNNHNSSKA